jgi:hypothetical protein
MAPDPELARLEAEVNAKRERLTELEALVRPGGTMVQGEVERAIPLPNLELEDEIRRAEAELKDAERRYEEALNP